MTERTKFVRVIHLLEQVAFEDAVEGNGALNFGAVKVHATHLGARKEALRVAAKEKHGAVRGLTTVKQVEVGQHIGDGSGFGQRELAFVTGAAHEVRDGKRIYVVQCRLGARSFIEGTVLNRAATFQVIHETRVE